jgi:hypothetical protein
VYYSQQNKRTKSFIEPCNLRNMSTTFSVCSIQGHEVSVRRLSVSKCSQQNKRTKSFIEPRNLRNMSTTFSVRSIQGHEVSVCHKVSVCRSVLFLLCCIYFRICRRHYLNVLSSVWTRRHWWSPTLTSLFVFLTFLAHRRCTRQPSLLCWCFYI